MMRYLSVILLFASSFALGQDQYKLSFVVRGLKPGPVYLGFYQQDKTFSRDTAEVDANGRFSFQGNKKLNEGIYFLLRDASVIFDFVIGADQEFSIETSTDDYVTNMVVKGDEDNALFLENLKLLRSATKSIEPQIKILRDSTADPALKKEANKIYEETGKNVTAQQEKLIQANPKSVTARILKMNKQVSIPEPPKKADGSIDSTFQLRYYTQHYFDNFGLGDEVMLRVHKVVYWDKVQYYLDKLFIQHPDTLFNRVDRLIAVAKSNQDTYKYLVWNAIVYYQNHSIMGLDQVYVKLVDKYITSGEMDYWLDKKTVSNMRDYADKLRRAPIGSTAPNLIMQDAQLQAKSMYDIKSKYTVVFFFKPSCSHCREETPKLVTLYNQKKKTLNFEVFAVSTDTAMKEMKDFIRDFKTPWITVNGPRSYIKEHFSKLYYAELTPTVYVLDERKKVIARRIDVEQIDDFIENYEKMEQRKKVAAR
ncbi:MAG TPA: thioredoxin-like domain-containing protein [Chryseosolibacter sp.]